MRNGSETLEFDIDYFARYQSRDVSEIVPNDFMESLLQTVFYKVAGDEMSLPYEYAPKKFVMLPRVLCECVDAVERFTGELRLVLEDDKYDRDW